MKPRDTSFRSPIYLALACTFWLNAAAICAMAASDNVSRPEAWVATAICAALAARAPFLRIRLRRGELIVHQWLHARTVALADIQRVKAGSYDGLWVRGSPSKQVAMVQIHTTSGDLIKAKGVLAMWKTGKIQNMAHQISRRISTDTGK